MLPKIINTEAEQDSALARLEALIDAAVPGSPAEAELAEWSHLIEQYEEDHFPVSPARHRTRFGVSAQRSAAPGRKIRGGRTQPTTRRVRKAGRLDS